MGTGIQWAEVETGFFAASTRTGFVGCIDSTSRGFAAFDGRGTPLGTFPSMDEAKTALRAALDADQLGDVVAAQPSHRPAQDDATLRGSIPRVAAATVAAATSLLSQLRARTP